MFVKKRIEDASVLIVDDNAVNRQVLLFALRKYGMKICIAENGQEAFEIMKKTPCDLVLMDIMMPVMDGIEATVAIREYECLNNLVRSLIVAVSAHVQDEDIDIYMKNGFDLVTKKPVNHIELKNWLSSWFVVVN